jgi:hypothetical protein
MYLITVLASGGGGNFQALIDNQARGGYKVNLLIVDRGCGSVQRAVENKITYKLLDKSFYKDDYFTVIKGDTARYRFDCASWIYADNTRLGVQRMAYENDNNYILEIDPRSGCNLIPEVKKYATGVDLIAYSIDGAMGKNVQI